jgi:hypothetical protein
MSKNNLLCDLFKSYCKFLVIENQTALIEGRNYNVIYMFLINMSYILVKDGINFDEAEKSIQDTKSVVDDFIEVSQKKYDYIKIKNCCKYDDKLSMESFHFKQEEESIFEDFYKVYSIYSHYKKVVIVEELLIEFNNFLSHFAQHITDSNKSTGVSHLYRGCLDGHKDIIKENNKVLISKDYPELIKDFIKLRIYETKDIGNTNKIFSVVNKSSNILRMYDDISNSIITILENK